MQLPDGEPGIGRIGSDTRSYGSASKIHLVEESGVLLDSLDLLLKRDRVSLELLPQAHGHGILQLRPAHLDDTGELSSLFPK